MPGETVPRSIHSRNLGLRLARQRVKPHPHPPLSRSVKLAKINHLPRAELEPPLFDRPCQVIPDHRRLHMRRRIPLPMPILPTFPRHRLLQGNRHVPTHIRIRALLDCDPRRGVGNHHVQQPVPPASPGGHLLQDLC